jgi:CRP-like cAMP-binding protein
MRNKNVPYNIECEECISLKKCIFSDLEPEELKEIVKNKATNHYQKGQSLFFQGNHPLGLFCVVRGNIKGSQSDINGKESIVRLITAGDIMGHRAIFSNECHCATATALESSTTCFFSREYILKIVQEKPSIALNIIKQLCVDMGTIEHKFASMYQKNVRGRLAELLLTLKDNFGTRVNEKWHLEIKLSREEMASMIGVANETLIRLLSEFKEKGVIKQNGKTIAIVDEQTLRDIV